MPKGSNKTREQPKRPETLVAKVVLFGESGVGKTSILNRYIYNTYESPANTIGAGFLSNEVSGKYTQTIKLHLWDTAGRERYQPLGDLYYSDAHIALLVFDISCKRSFEYINYYKEELLRSHKDPDNLIFVVIGNKSDLDDRKVSKQSIDDLVEYWECPYYEVSAKTGKNIHETFEEIARIRERSFRKRPKSIAIKEPKHVNSSSLFTYLSSLFGYQ